MICFFGLPIDLILSDYICYTWLFKQILVLNNSVKVDYKK